ncbi:hypothetical protein L3V79_01380 [Thiotrichales bacterium 19S9-12]|nr:hypothetical protein [Thiotrichales bacterium 19S9-11]MCF6811010.1 hypothetical protein [Thiotrichales bacterium 19S9-12]
MIYRLIMLYFIFIVPAFSFSNTSIYTWEDKSGQRHYSSDYNKDAQTINLPEPQTIPINNMHNKAAYDKTSKPMPLTIISPKNNQSFHYQRENIPIITMGVTAFINHNQTHQVQISLNHKPILTTRTLPISINTPTPGTYTLKLAIIDEKNRVIAKSQAITIYILPHPKVETAGTKKITNETYQKESTENYQDFYNEHKNHIIQPEKPFRPTWQNYNNQISP